VLHINDVFWTFQGEGFHAGTRALFVRMPFCNLECSWCDTTFDTFKKWTEPEFAEFATRESARFAVITGGEPMMHKHTQDVINLLRSLGFYIQCETNGTFPVKAGIDWICVSPKRDANYKIDLFTFKAAHEFKYVVDEGFNFDILKTHDTTDGRRYSLSPEFGRFTQSLEEIFAYIKEHPRWKISLQTHKWMKIS
jgi:7-carboxy-7-deazaguanine synthase